MGMEDIDNRDKPVSSCPHCKGHGFIPNLDCSGQMCECNKELEDYKDTALYIIREAMQRVRERKKKGGDN